MSAAFSSGVFLIRGNVQGLRVARHSFVNRRRVATVLGQQHESLAKMPLAVSPQIRSAIASSLLQGQPIGGNRLFEPSRPSFAASQRGQGLAQVVLDLRPIMRVPSTAHLLRSGPRRIDGVANLAGIRLYFPCRKQRAAQVLLTICPLERMAFAGTFFQREPASCESLAQPPSRLPNAESDQHKLLRIRAQASGARSLLASCRPSL